MIPGIYHCKICGYKASSHHINTILTHLHDKHDIKRGSRTSGPSQQFLDYLEQYFGNPRCACGCGRKVVLHKRKMQYNLFANDCPNKGRYNNPVCPEFYLFRGERDLSTIVNKIRSLQSKTISDDHKKKLSEKNSGDKNPSSLHSLSEKFGGIDAAKRYLSSRALRGKDNPFYGKTHDAATRQRMAVAHANQPRVSSLQNILYSILDDLGVQYYREYEDKPNDPETIVGPYNFDCMIPRNGEPDLLIECQGEYWYNLTHIRKNDKSKHTYITKYFRDRYELKYLWEHEFLCKERIYKQLKYWLRMTTIELVQFKFNDVTIKCAKPSEYKPLLMKYHYLSNAGRGGRAFGAYYGDKIISVCVFSPLQRNNLPWDSKTTLELSRLCIHPHYQKKNFGSWFVSRCLKILPQEITTIIAYCDISFNHNGAIYKACNFELDGETRPDYWYINDDGWVIHKQTLYNHARKFKMTEQQYAKQQGFRKVHGHKKLRFVYRLR